MSIEREILEFLNKSRNKRTLRYKGLRVGFLGLPDFKYYKYQSLANGCSTLKKKGYIRKGDLDNYSITRKGIEFLEKNKDIAKIFETENDGNSPKNLLVMYDIPQEKRKERDWFRRHLKKFHFIMIQKSVWVGPSPLPKEFLAYVKEIKLGENFKTFKLAKGYNQK